MPFMRPKFKALKKNLHPAFFLTLFYGYAFCFSTLVQLCHQNARRSPKPCLPRCSGPHARLPLSCLSIKPTRVYTYALHK